MRFCTCLFVAMGMSFLKNELGLFHVISPASDLFFSLNFLYYLVKMACLLRGLFVAAG